MIHGNLPTTMSLRGPKGPWQSVPRYVLRFRKVLESMNYYVYILSNITGTAIYVGVTNNLLRRMYEHRNKLDPKSFTAKYDIHKLVYYEYTNDVHAALEREKQIKGWNRARKNRLVEGMNPKWEDLYASILP